MNKRDKGPAFMELIYGEDTVNKTNTCTKQLQRVNRIEWHDRGWPGRGCLGRPPWGSALELTDPRGQGSALSGSETEHSVLREHPVWGWEKARLSCWEASVGFAGVENRWVSRFPGQFFALQLVTSECPQVWEHELSASLLSPPLSQGSL